MPAYRINYHNNEIDAIPLPTLHAHRRCQL